MDTSVIIYHVQGLVDKSRTFLARILLTWGLVASSSRLISECSTTTYEVLKHVGKAAL